MIPTPVYVGLNQDDKCSYDTVWIQWLMPLSMHAHILPSFLPSLLTSWCRILFEKLIVTQLVKKISRLLMEPEGSSLCSQNPATRPYPEPMHAHISTLSLTL
jgi:hypothetical protein